MNKNIPIITNAPKILDILFDLRYIGINTIHAIKGIIEAGLKNIIPVNPIQAMIIPLNLFLDINNFIIAYNVRIQRNNKMVSFNCNAENVYNSGEKTEIIATSRDLSSEVYFWQILYINTQVSAENNDWHILGTNGFSPKKYINKADKFG
jgi:hypothetical protein